MPVGADVPRVGRQRHVRLVSGRRLQSQQWRYLDDANIPIADQRFADHQKALVAQKIHKPKDMKGKRR